MKRKAITLLACAFATAMALCLVGCGSSEPPQELQTVETGFIENEFGTTDYAVVVENPNEDVTAEFPTITVTGYDKDGAILFSHDAMTDYIYPGEKTYITGSDQASNVDHLEVQATVTDENWITVSDDDKYTFEVSDVNDQISEYGDITFTGNVTNNSSTDVSTVMVNVLCRDADGKLLCGYTTYADTVPAGGSRTFSAYSIGAVPGYNSCDVKAELGYL